MKWGDNTMDKLQELVPQKAKIKYLGYKLPLRLGLAVPMLE